jgi:20S proteasome alpha/beta subunit
MFQLLVKALTTEAAKQLALVALKELAKRTDNTVDDALVAYVTLNARTKSE